MTGILSVPAAPQAPQVPETPSGGFKTFADYQKWFHGQDNDGSDFGGGQAGINNRGYEMSGRGRAPFTAEGLATAFGNAVSAIKGPLSPTGLLGLGANLPGVRPDGLIGNLLGSKIQNIPGWTAYDTDLRQAILHGMPLSRADAEQARRNATRTQEARQGRSFAGGTGNQSIAGGRSVGGLAVGNDGRVAGGI